MNFPHQLSGVCLALAVSLALTPAITQAQSHGAEAASGAARIESFGVGQLDRVRPGSELEFTLSGTRGAQVTLEIAGAGKPVTMDETRPGHYEGAYTVRSRDRITAGSLVTARMLKDGRSITTSLDQSIVIGAPSPAAGLAQIAAFTITAPDHVRPGDELAFSMTGTPGAKAAVVVKGVRDRIALTEVSRGAYQGRYTLRRQDRPDESLSSTGYLKVNNRESNLHFERRSVASRTERHDEQQDAQRDARSEARADEQRAVQMCANCGVIESVRVVESKGDGNNVIGTIAGGVLGGVLGHQVGGGTGKDLATIAGAVGGAYAGNRVENNMGQSKQYEVVVRFENATTRTFTYAADPAINVGTRVKVENNVIERR